MSETNSEKIRNFADTARNILGFSRDAPEKNRRMEELSPEGRALYLQGEDYIVQFRGIAQELNSAEITGRIHSLAEVLRRILEETLKKPDRAPELRKMMNYYLPTTWKLLTSYRSISGEAVKTAEMKKTMEEIKGMLDTVHEAFCNFLDRLMRTEVWDIRSDISVLNTMLRQDSLKNSDFGREEKNEEEETK